MAWNLEGAAFHALGRYDEALAAYNKALELNPYYGQAIDNRDLVLKLIDNRNQ
ncbi:MAG: tetratricopeptide repeat protein [Thermoproteota archaeon]|nr:tetratricopeptide repeat protein [Thermoproteota archaeon]